MKTYKITGAIKETGEDYNHTIECEDEAWARGYAQRVGVLVSAVTLVPDGKTDAEPKATTVNTLQLY